MSTTTKVTLGICGALAAGVVIGLMIAPEKGTETRKKISKTAGEWVDQLTHLFSKAEEHIDEAKKVARTAKAVAEEA